MDENSITSRQLKDASNVRLMADKRFAALPENSLPCSSVNPSDYEAIYLSGGHGTMFDFRQSKELQKLITAFYVDNKVLSGVCHGVAGFIDSTDSNGNLIVQN